MASPTTPTHGKQGAVWRLRPNGFKGAGLNDLSWGSAATNAASAYYEVVIDAEGAPDTFKWRKDGGGWTSGVAITGAAQALDEGQTITFAATTGHTLNDQWMIGNLVAEATTEAGATAQITDATKRLLNPNSPPTFTDDGGANVLRIDYTTGTAYFDANVGNVTVAGNNSYVEASALEKVGYIYGWTFNVSLELTDITPMGSQWKEHIVGDASASGSADCAFIGTDSFLDALTESATGTEKYSLLQLFNYDPDQDQTGDHHLCWATFNSVAVNGNRGDMIKEPVGFQVIGIPSFIANT